MGVFLHRQPSLSFHARADGGLHGFVVVTVGLEHKAFRAEDFRLEPRPQHLFGGHAVVGEKDVFVVVADFFRYFDFYTAFLPSLINRLNLSYNSCILYSKEALNYGY